MSETIQAVKGMNDILPPDSARWEWFEETVRALMRRYGYLNVRTPIVEPTPLFVRGLGEVTDIVEKEMYSWVDSMNGDPLTLRPEGTASACTTSGRCSDTNARSVAATGSFIKWGWRPWVLVGPMWTLKSF